MNFRLAKEKLKLLKKMKADRLKKISELENEVLNRFNPEIDAIERELYEGQAGV